MLIIGAIRSVRRVLEVAIEGGSYNSLWLVEERSRSCIFHRVQLLFYIQLWMQ